MGTMTLRPLPLDPELALGTIAECLANPLAAGSFDDFSYCVANGRQVLLGHHSGPSVQSGKTLELKASPINYVFVSRSPQHHRHATTWEELCDYVDQGWVIGTERYPGVKIWFASTGRNHRREPERIWVLRGGR